MLLFNISPIAAKHINSGYAGADACVKCHEEIYNAWKTSGHAKILRKVSELKVNNITFPEGYSRKDISYVIGGFKWEMDFLDSEGYLITPAKNVPYDCGGCHTTGYSPEGHQNGFKGIIGTWKYDGVQCEACHGPGAQHAASPSSSDISIDRNICSKCHSTEQTDIVPLLGNFLAPYTEVNQLKKSKKGSFACVDCHNPHYPSEKSIIQTCESCHEKAAAVYRESFMYEFKVTCVDCHMPPAGIVAQGDDETFRGDLKSHLFKIDHTRKSPFEITKNGQRINPGYLTVDYACLPCHSLRGDRQWASRFGIYAHNIKITTNVKIMKFELVFASIGFLFAIIAFLSAAFMKGWLPLSFDKKTLRSIHKISAWSTFSIYLFLASLCIYFHFPIDKPTKILELGWFLIHPVSGVIGLIIYSGKILVVRKYKKGWASQGVIWGTALFVFWLIQYFSALVNFLEHIIK
jgi:hypothetical protein